MKCDEESVLNVQGPQQIYTLKHNCCELKITKKLQKFLKRYSSSKVLHSRSYFLANRAVCVKLVEP